MRPNTSRIIEAFVEQQGTMIIDGGLATGLESHGCDLDDPLWSARVLIENPELIQRVHREYLDAGADCIISASYQASIDGFLRQGHSESKAIELLKLSVSLAVELRDDFWSHAENRKGRMKPVVAASVGPYGAVLADGSEFRGDYDLDDAGLYDFHAARWRVLAGSRADLLACETIPSARECAILLNLLRETPDMAAWISFSCRDGRHLNDGSSLTNVLRSCDSEDGVAALGINCTSPDHLPVLIECARQATSKPIVVYPNSGEIFDPETKCWHSGPYSVDWTSAVLQWRELGASAIGGCCRVGPTEIAMMRKSLLD